MDELPARAQRYRKPPNSTFVSSICSTISLRPPSPLPTTSTCVFAPRAPPALMPSSTQLVGLLSSLFNHEKNDTICTTIYNTAYLFLSLTALSGTGAAHWLVAYLLLDSDNFLEPQLDAIANIAGVLPCQLGLRWYHQKTERNQRKQGAMEQ